MNTQKKKLNRFCSFMVRRRLFVLLFVLVGVAVCALGATKIKSTVVLTDLFPYDHPYLKLHYRFSEVFGGGGFGVVIAVKVKEGDIFNQETLSKVKDMTNELLLGGKVYRLLTSSIATYSTKVVITKAKGEIIFDQLMFPDVPQNDEEMELLERNIFSNPAFSGVLVSRDRTMALIFTQVIESLSYDEAFELIQGLEAKYGDENTSIHAVGFPVLMGWIESFKPQMYWVFGISVAAMVLILFLIFRNLVGMIAPIAMALICTALGMGFVGWTGLNFSPLLFVLAFLVGARMLSNAVQITNRYIFEYHAGAGEETGRRRGAADRTMRAMLMPNAAAVATDAVGFLVLGLAKIVLMQQIAIMMSFWMVTIILSGVLVPVICSFLPRLGAKDTSAEDKKRGLEKVTVPMARFSMFSGKYIIVLGAIVIVIFGGWETTKLKVGDPTPGSPVLWPDHKYNQDQALINTKFDASSEDFMLFYEGKTKSVYDPVVSETFDAFTRHMARTLPDIFKSSTSVNDIAKMINLMLRDGNHIWYEIPIDRRTTGQLFGYIKKSVGMATFARYVDKDLERAQITLYFSDHTADNLLRIREAAFDFFKDRPMKTENGEFKLAGGAVGLEMALNQEMRRSHAVMDTMVLVAIFFMCAIAFRSFVAGAMLAVPLILSNLVAFAYMAITDIGLSVNTLPCSAVGVGVGVDFSIYLYSRCKEEFPRHNNWEETVLTAVRTAGRGIVFTGITLILPILTWYFISALKFQAQMGFFLSMLLFTNMIATLTLHPLLILWIKPRFMTKNAVAADNG